MAPRMVIVKESLWSLMLRSQEERLAWYCWWFSDYIFVKLVNIPFGENSLDL